MVTMSLLQAKSSLRHPAEAGVPADTHRGLATGLIRRAVSNQFLWTFLANCLLFGIFFVQGAILARCLGPTGRGEFGSILFFPRDLLLYVGMMGAVEVTTALAGRFREHSHQLRIAGVRLGLMTGLLTGIAALLFAFAFLNYVGKSSLLGLIAVTSLFLPLEHIQMIVSGVDRGQGYFTRYNCNRLFFAALFPVLVLAWFGLGLDRFWPGQELATVCLLFVGSRLLGLLPTLIPPQAERLAAAGVVGGQASDLEVNFRPRNLLSLGKGYGLSMLASECFERLDVLLIVLLASFSDAGNYFVAIPAATLVTLLPNAAGLFAFNVGANQQFQRSGRWLSGVMGLAFVVQLATAALLWFVLPVLIPIVFGPGFEQATVFALWLLPICALKGYLQLADGFLKGRGHSMVGVWARVAAILLMLLAVWLLLPTWELYAIPMGALLGQILVAIVVSGACLRVGSNSRAGFGGLGGDLNG